MTIQELIDQLEQLKAEHGDIPVVVEAQMMGDAGSIHERFNVHSQEALGGDAYREVRIQPTW